MSHHRIDVHHHILPPAYVAWLRSVGIDEAGAIALESSRPLEDVLDDFRSFYFDTALSSTPAALPTLLAFAKPGHVLFGSDWPFAPSSGVGLFAGMLDAYPGLDDAGHRAINRGSAERLFPRFAP